MTTPQRWPIFICYRRADGIDIARKLNEILRNWQTKGPAGKSIQFDVYLDEDTPAVDDWKKIHRPYLEKARSMIVICTPGVKINEGPHDYVHKEIDWWLEHRKVAPILIDPLMEGLRTPYGLAQAPDGSLVVSVVSAFDASGSGMVIAVEGP